MACAVQAFTHYQTYPERSPGADLPPQNVCNVVRVASEALERRVELVWGAMACGAVSEKYVFGLETPQTPRG